MSRVADIAGWCVCMKPSNAWFTRHKPRSSSVIAGMNALPATAFAAAGSWNRSSQADRADDEGTARSRVRRQRAFSERRSARDNKSRSIARRIAAKPLSVSSRSRSSTQSPPARFRKITASTIWISSQPCAPATRTCWRIAVPSPLAWIRSRYSGSPASEVRPPLEVSASYWKPRTPCASIPHLVGDGFGFANGAYLPDSSGPTGNSDYFGAEFRAAGDGHRAARLRSGECRLGPDLSGAGRGGLADRTPRRVPRPHHPAVAPSAVLGAVTDRAGGGGWLARPGQPEARQELPAVRAGRAQADRRLVLGPRACTDGLRAVCRAGERPLHRLRRGAGVQRA